MATADLRVVHPESRSRTEAQINKPLHRIQEVRKQQNVSLRTAARRMGSDIRSVRAQEQECSDLRLSQLYQWQDLLDVPMVELFEEQGIPLSRPVMERAQMIRVMKTAVSLVENAESDSTARFATMLVEQLKEIMPELGEVSGWHSVGQRRSLDECGRIAERPIPDSFLGTPPLSFD